MVYLLRSSPAHRIQRQPRQKQRENCQRDIKNQTRRVNHSAGEILIMADHGKVIQDFSDSRSSIAGQGINDP